MNKTDAVFAAAGIFVLFLCASPAFPHGGGLDAQGCHTESKTGDRHCHGVPKYDRKQWHPGWEDADGDCQNARHEVLISESLVPVRLSADGCRVVSGKWVDPFSAKTFTDPRGLDIDHLVPLKEAHESGGSAWSARKKRMYANDLHHPDTLIAVSREENRAKGAKDPARWLPSNRAYRCEYVRSWKRVKRIWGLSSDPAEERAIRKIERECGY